MKLSPPAHFFVSHSPAREAREDELFELKLKSAFAPCPAFVSSRFYPAENDAL